MKAMMKVLSLPEVQVPTTTTFSPAWSDAFLCSLECRISLLNSSFFADSIRDSLSCQGREINIPCQGMKVYWETRCPALLRRLPLPIAPGDQYIPLVGGWVPY